MGNFAGPPAPQGAKESEAAAGAQASGGRGFAKEVVRLLRKKKPRSKEPWI